MHRRGSGRTLDTPDSLVARDGRTQRRGSAHVIDRACVASSDTHAPLSNNPDPLTGRPAACPRRTILGHEKRCRQHGQAGVPGPSDDMRAWDESQASVSAYWGPASLPLCARGERSGRPRCRPGITRRAPVVAGAVRHPAETLEAGRALRGPIGRFVARPPFRSAHCRFIVLTPGISAQLLERKRAVQPPGSADLQAFLHPR